MKSDTTVEASALSFSVSRIFLQFLKNVSSPLSSAIYLSLVGAFQACLSMFRGTSKTKRQGEENETQEDGFSETVKSIILQGLRT